MKKSFYFIAFIAISLCSCTSENSYVFKGRFLNGTTNKPYVNVSVDFTETIGPKGQRDFVFLGSTVTDSNGCFTFKYSIEENSAASLWLDFGDTGYSSLYQKSGLPIDQNNDLTFYLSDSNTSVFNLSTLQPLKSNEKLRVYTFGHDFDTLLSNSQIIAMNNKFSVRSSSHYFYIGIERKSMDSTISFFEKYVELEGDPKINEISLTY